jgi:hypothetical protein
LVLVSLLPEVIVFLNVLLLQNQGHPNIESY